jgi:aspartyl-tRNA(Asn)/glutamyl-tRNA(Gln) amidotransferase subunit A
VSVRRGTSVARTEACLARIAHCNPRLNAFLAVTADAAREAAAAADARRARAAALGPLDGVPVALKDNIDLAGVPTTAGVGARRGRVARTDAESVRRLKAAGAVILGKLNLHEGAHGATNANLAFGACINPHREGHTPGGSSGGSAAATAAGLCAAALGTDTLGSIRMPASFCGVVGFKPTRGLVSTDGVVPLARMLDHVGPIAPRVEDLFPVLEAICEPVPGREDAGRAGGLRLGRLVDFAQRGGMALDPEVAAGYESALGVLRDLGAQVIDVSLDGFDALVVRAAALQVIESELAGVYADDLARDPEGFSEALRSAARSGLAHGSAALASARAAIDAVRAVAERLFGRVDALLTPTTPCTSFRFDGEVPRTLSVYTAFANYVGAPSVSVPMGFSRRRLPMGLLVTARTGDDGTALRIAAAYERAAGWDMRPTDTRPRRQS